MASALDDRTFENAVEQTPEEQAATLAHFKDKGYDVEVEDRGEEQHQPGAPKTPAPEPAKSAAAAPAPEKEAPPAAGAPAAEGTETIDAETRAEYQAESAKPDEEKLGRHAKRSRELKTLRSTVSEKDAKLAVQEATIAELRARVAQPATPSTLVTPPQPTTAPPPEPAKKEEPIKPQEFSEAKPTRPKLEDYADQDDPVVALEDARTEYTEKLIEWNDKRRAFDNSEKQRVETAQRQRDDERQSEVTRADGINQKLTAVKAVHPDFDATTNAANFGRDKTNMIMRHLLVEEIPDGLELAWQLAQPEHKAELEEIIRKVGDPKSQAEIGKGLYTAAQEIAIFRYKIQSAQPKTPAASDTPPAPGAPQAIKVPEAPPSSTEPPRREEPSPTPVKGRSAAATLTPADVDPMDSDARRALRKQRGEM